MTFPNVSAGMGQLKIGQVMKQTPEFLISGDMGCAMHLGGLITREGHRLKCLHLAEVLAMALEEGR